MAQKDRYVALDMLRGVAALTVLLFHANEHFAGLFLPDSGYLAVDLFFLLSGFVVAWAYDEKFHRGWHAIAFLKIRLIRLYPLYLLALLIGTMKLLAQFWVGQTPPAAGALAADFALELFFLPNPTTMGAAYDTTFPINPAAWSLLLELLLNVGYAIAFRWLCSRKNLISTVVLSGAVLFVVVAVHGSDQVGNSWNTFMSGIPRAIFPFFLGVLLSRTKTNVPALGNSLGIVLPIALFCVLAVVPLLSRMIWDAACIFLVFPVVVVVGAAVQPTGILRRVSMFAGATSYALYTLHLPMVGLLDAFLRHREPQWHLWIGSGPLVVVALMLACWLADRYYDDPVRRWLKTHNNGDRLVVLGGG